MPPSPQGMRSHPSEDNLRKFRRSNTDLGRSGLSHGYGEPQSRRMSMRVPLKTEGPSRSNSPDFAIDWSHRSVQAIRSNLDLSALSNKIGVPRGQHDGRRRAQPRKGSGNLDGSGNAIDWSSKSDMTGMVKSRYMQPRRGSSFMKDDRKRSNSLDNLPEDVPAVMKRAAGEPQMRKSDPGLGNVDFGDIEENLYDEVLMDLYACVANNQQANPNSNQGTKQQRRNSVAKLPRIKNSSSSESLDFMAQFENPPNQGTNQQRRNSVKPGQTMKNSKSNESLGSLAFSYQCEDPNCTKQKRRNSVVKMPQIKSSNSNENLTFLAQQSMNLNSNQGTKQQRRNSAMIKSSKSIESLGSFAQPLSRSNASRESLGSHFMNTKAATRPNQRRNSNWDDDQLHVSRSNDNLFEEAFGKQRRRESTFSSSKVLQSRSHDNLDDAFQDQEKTPNKSKGGDMKNVFKLAAQMEMARMQNPNDQKRLQDFTNQISKLRGEGRASGELSGLSNGSGDDVRRFSGISNGSGRPSGGPGQRQSVAVTEGDKPQRKPRRKSITKGVANSIKKARRRSITSRNDKSASAAKQLRKKSSKDSIKEAQPVSDLFAPESKARLDISEKLKSDTKNDSPGMEMNCPETDKQKLKLYDELLSASNTDRYQAKASITKPGTESTMQTSQTIGALSLDKSNRSFGLVVRKNKRARRCGRCRKKDKKFLFGLVFLLVGIIGGYLVFRFLPAFHNSDKDDNEVVEDANTKEDVDTEPSIMISSGPTVIEPPPPDIEGMCSVSNLPGALSACLAACLPSACCYSSYTGESCFDENDPKSVAACSSYRPYCDVFYDDWVGGTEGVLRKLTDDMVKTCTGAKDIIVDKTPILPDSSSLVKRLRGHVVPNQNGDFHSGTSRSLFMTSMQETCQNYCITAKCCLAPVVSHPESSGLMVSPTGVFTNSSNNEYVVTSCRTSNSENIELCEQYQSFCSTDDQLNSSSQVSEQGVSTKSPSLQPVTALPTSVPTLNPTTKGPMTVSVSSPANDIITPSITTPVTTASSLPVSVAPTRSPSASPISSAPSSMKGQTMTTATPMTVLAVAIPSAPTDEIQEFCSSDKATFLIATGDTQARSKCIKACQDGMCCFATQLGYDWMDSCYVGNEQICAEYSACLVLQEEDVNEGVGGTNLDDFKEDHDNAINSATSNADSKEDGSATDPQQPGDYNGTTTAIASDSARLDGPPVPEQSLAILCSDDYIAEIAGLKQCIKACDLGKCCSSNSETGCFSTHTETCNLYSPCMKAYDTLYSDDDILN